MRKITILLLFFLFASVEISLAQTAYLKGTVIDTTEKKNLPNSVISLIRKSDSVLVAFTRSNLNGEFNIGLKRGAYILLVTYPKFADYVDEITIGDSTVNLDKIILTPKSQLLKEVVVRQKIAAIRIKGDTLEYRADSFAVKPGATVEDLL